jgi:hypothetical protein
LSAFLTNRLPAILYPARVFLKRHEMTRINRSKALSLYGQSSFETGILLGEPLQRFRTLEFSVLPSSKAQILSFGRAKGISVVSGIGWGTGTDLRFAEGPFSGEGCVAGPGRSA